MSRYELRGSSEPLRRADRHCGKPVIKCYAIIHFAVLPLATVKDLLIFAEKCKDICFRLWRHYAYYFITHLFSFKNEPRCDLIMFHILGDQ